MIEIVIKYNDDKQMYGIYEPSTNTYMLSGSLSEGLVYLEQFLTDAKMIGTSLLDSDVSYHLDSKSMKAMVESNTALMKRLNTAPSGFTLAQQRFGGSTGGGQQKSSFNGKGSSGTFSNSKFKESYKKFGKKG